MELIIELICTDIRCHIIALHNSLQFDNVSRSIIVSLSIFVRLSTTVSLSTTTEKLAMNIHHMPPNQHSTQLPCIQHYSLLYSNHVILTPSLVNSYICLASCQNKFVILLTFHILFRMQNDQTASSSPANHFASVTKYRKWNITQTSLLDFVANITAACRLKG